MASKTRNSISIETTINLQFMASNGDVKLLTKNVFCGGKKINLTNNHVFDTVYDCDGDSQIVFLSFRLIRKSIIDTITISNIRIV